MTLIKFIWIQTIILALCLGILLGTAMAGINFKMTEEGLRETREDYIAYVSYMKKIDAYQYFSPEMREWLEELGKKYDLPPDKVSSPVNGESRNIFMHATMTLEYIGFQELNIVRKDIPPGTLKYLHQIRQTGYRMIREAKLPEEVRDDWTDAFIFIEAGKYTRAIESLNAVRIAVSSPVKFSPNSALAKQIKDFKDVAKRLESLMIVHVQHLRGDTPSDIQHKLDEIEGEGLRIIGDKHTLREGWKRIFKHLKKGEYVDAGQTLDLVVSSATVGVGSDLHFSSRPLTPTEEKEWKKGIE